MTARRRDPRSRASFPATPEPCPRRRADAGPDGRQAVTGAIFARLDAPGFERLECGLTADAIDLGLDAA